MLCICRARGCPSKCFDSPHPRHEQRRTPAIPASEHCPQLHGRSKPSAWRQQVDCMSLPSSDRAVGNIVSEIRWSASTPTHPCLARPSLNGLSERGVGSRGLQRSGPRYHPGGRSVPCGPPRRRQARPVPPVRPERGPGTPSRKRDSLSFGSVACSPWPTKTPTRGSWGPLDGKIRRQAPSRVSNGPTEAPHRLTKRGERAASASRRCGILCVLAAGRRHDKVAPLRKHHIPLKSGALLNYRFTGFTGHYSILKFEQAPYIRRKISIARLKRFPQQCHICE